MAKGKNPKHTACRPGTKVIITLVNGTKIVDVFVERKSGTIFLKKYGRLTKDMMSSFAVYKERPWRIV